MTTSFTIQEYSIPASILQQILAKMDLKSLVRLCQSSTYGQDTVDELQSARLERYLAAKRDKHELSKYLPRDEILSKRTLIIIMRMDFLERRGMMYIFDVFYLDKPFAKLPAKLVELAQKTLNNWEILHYY